jgi:DNA-binding NarL/FixJ family response regulator
MDGYELVRQVRQKPAFRLFPVVFLSERNTVEERIRGYEAGCDAYLPKPFEIKELVVVIRYLFEKAMRMGAGFLNPWIQDEPKPTTESEPDNINKIDDFPQDASTHSAPKSLDFNITEREKEVLVLLVKGGLTNRQIGTKLHLSHKTIEKYVSSLIRKTQTNNRTELVRFALENNLLD